MLVSVFSQGVLEVGVGRSWCPVFSQRFIPISTFHVMFNNILRAWWHIGRSTDHQRQHDSCSTCSTIYFQIPEYADSVFVIMTQIPKYPLNVREGVLKFYLFFFVIMFLFFFALHSSFC